MAPAVPEDSLSLFVVTMKKGRLGVSASAPMLGPGTTGRSTEREESAVLSEVTAKGFITTSDAAELLGVSATTVNRKLKKIVGAGVLRQDGCKGRSSRYELA